jgi:EAL domain-containing protein (putative c-di-GMP-specific phosphodiesterase class I)
MDDAGPHLDFMHDIRSLGVHLAVDDFGTGYSSLAYLKTLPVSILKIDRSFVSGLGGPDPTAPAIVSAIVGMAQAMGLQVIAEGVETEAQLEELRRLGVGLGQGYLWSWPMAPETVPTWFATRAAQLAGLQ